MLSPAGTSLGLALLVVAFPFHVEPLAEERMSDRIVVYSVTADAEPDADVAKRLQEKGVEIIEKQPHMFLLSGDRQAIGQVVRAARGWSVSGETKVPPPNTRERILKRP